MGSDVLAAPTADPSRGRSDPASPTDGAAPGFVARWWREARYPLSRYLRVGSVLWIVSWLSIELLDRHHSYLRPPVAFRGTAFLEGWMRWDGNWYERIAGQGYSYTPGQQSSVAFFPSYPLAMRVVGTVLRDDVLAGILITIVCGALVAVLLHHWCRLRFPNRPELARRSVLVFLLWPYAYYLFGAVYADGLFLFATVLAFVLLEHDHPWLAALAGIVATAARPVGVGVVVGLVCVALARRKVVEGRRLHLSRVRVRDLAGGLSVLGLLAWCLYLQRNWGDPLLFSSVQGSPGWDQAAGPYTWFKIALLKEIAHLPQWAHDSIWPLDVRGYDPWDRMLYCVGCMLQGTMVLGFLALIPRVWRRLGWGYAAYAATVVIIPLLGSKDFQGTGRYLLAAFPVFVVLTDELGLRDRFRRRLWFPASATLLVVWTSFFARGYYIA